ncbi:MAG TPA: alkaline phosphatase PhoX [Burkholderiales bacterium]|jgi:hypothetical protein
MKLGFTRRTIAPLLALPLLSVAAQAAAQQLTHVPLASPRIAGVTSPTALSPELQQIVRAQGSMPVENPGGGVAYYGYRDDHPNLVPALGSTVEASKTEPDKNTYLVLEGQSGADANYDYGRRFVYQGHEGPASLGIGYITRINLDADFQHRVTVLAIKEAAGVTNLPVFDGNTWYPWSERLLFTFEGNGTTTGGVWQATPDFPSKVVPLLGVMGRGGFEGIQADSAGNLWIVEDIGGATPAGQTNARLPNSFIFRLVPKNRRDLTQGGKLQVLQVMSKATPGQPIRFQSASTLTQDIKDLHTYGIVFATEWITIHDTAVQGFATFNANQLAKDAGGTPFKRPENGMFRPGTHFREFYFTETGDTNATTVAAPDHGGFGGIQKLTQASPSADTGNLTLFFRGDLEHTAFDNLAFFDADRMIAVEDRGETLHTQGNALDSGWLLDARVDYSSGSASPARIIAQGRDPSATIDAQLLGSAGFINDGDNELTGIHVSDGDADVNGILGAKIPRPFKDGWRVFYTQQHGENVTYEIVRQHRAGGRHGGEDDDDDRW